MREVLNVISDQPLYLNSFDNLLQEFLDYKQWTLSHLCIEIDCDRQSLYRYRYNGNCPKEKIVIICLALGLDLVSTMICLMSKGLTLNPVLDFDRKCMIFINNTKNDGLDRVWEFYKYMEENK